MNAVGRMKSADCFAMREMADCIRSARAFHLKRKIFLLAALAVFSGCARNEEAPAPAAEEPAPVDAAAEPIEGDAASAWIEMNGVWAPAGGCGDYAREWRLEAEAFHRHEMHCAIVRLEMLQNGVRALAQCSVEGDDDGVEDAFKFVRRPDFTLSIINEANGFAEDGLGVCGEDAP